MAVLTSFDSLPAESIVQVFIFLSPQDIRRCQQVCRLFWNEIRGSPQLQYLLELDAFGYSAPLNPRLELSCDEKVKLLRETYKKPSQNDGLPQFVLPHFVELNRTESMITNCQFVRGVFAQGQPNLDITRALRIHQFPSLNKNTTSKNWELPDLPTDAHAYTIDPDLDLLVLLNIDSAPGDPDTDLIRTFYFRSLKSGEPHPLAVVPVITSTDRFTSTFIPEGFQIVGRYIALLSFTSQLLSVNSPRISVWDWTTGQLTTFADVIGNCFAFVSESCFMVESERRKYAKEIIGSLEIYKFDPATPGRRAHHVASLHLPTTPGNPCHSSINFVSSPSSPLSFSTNNFVTTVPCRVYDLSPTSHYICMQIRAYNIQAYPSEMTSGSLFISASSILDAIAGISSHGSQVHVPWEGWARGTSWINHRLAFCRPQNYVSGQRAALLMRNPDLDTCQIHVYELGPSMRTRLDNSLVSKLSSMPGVHQYLDNVFMSSGHARHPDLTSLITVSLELPADSDERPDIMLDDEHVTIHKTPRSQEDQHRLYVYTL